jgi:hypothetical protein
MVNDQLLDADSLSPYKLLVLPNIAALSDKQCEQLRQFVQRGGSLLATFETSRYDETGKARSNFGLSDLFGVTCSNEVEGPLQNSYLRIKPEATTDSFHPVVKGLEDAYRIINTTYRVKVEPTTDMPSPVTLVPTYPDLPMEDVYPRTGDSTVRELYLRQIGKGRVAYFNGDIDRAFWQIMSADHSQLIRNTIRWVLEEEPIVSVDGPGLVDVSAWRQEKSMTIHLVNLTNPMMMKGPFRELIPIDVRVTVRIPEQWKVTRGKLLMQGDRIPGAANARQFTVPVNIVDHEIIALDLA